ncbi:glycosyltransferase family 2 protein, partial [Gammaproteobacteria bacterium]|nr:glycosyltransferase family 2 protein [Gammaproteobacteria bacterium]
QLRKIRDNKLNVDVIIADGGSTDESLDFDFLIKQNVNAILIKEDVGKLSSQLRIAYFWALQRGYKGLITIDGNDKDDITFISNVFDALIRGFDYVQGSRYIDGGISKNTPLDRKIANKFIHAPIISLATGFKFTDTTNGLRGYSSKFLYDDQVQPFRDIFKNYELLFYLSVRACKLNFKVCEVPVSRIYPKDLATPTKISGLNSRIDILRETIQASAGCYDPR